MIKQLVVAVGSVVVSVVAQGATLDVTKLNEDGMFPFVPSYDSPKNVVNMSHLIEAPAGKHGRIRIEGGHFVNDKGRVRFNGTNLTGPANFPTHEEADRLVARLTRFGINCVRLHFFDTDAYKSFIFLKPAGAPTMLDSKSLKRFLPEKRELQDYLIAQFKKHGIYVNMNLHVARHLDSRDGFNGQTPWGNKGVNQFDPKIIAEEKAYAKEFLEHVNPYTGMNYLEDPVIAMVELNNEDGLWGQYLDGNLDHIGKPYQESLKNLWNEWLISKYGTTENLRALWDLSEEEFKPYASLTIEKREMTIVKSRDKVPSKVKRDYYQFIMDTAHNYWTGMKKYLQKDLGLKAPVCGTQLGSACGGFSAPCLQEELDFVEHNYYWCHPKMWKKWIINNQPMVKNRGGTISALTGFRIAGKPFTVSEYNHPYPNFYGAEGQPMLRAYGAFQGWDGVFEYTYNSSEVAEPTYTYQSFFGMVARTDVLAHFPACASIYLRGDVKESKTQIVANLPYEKYFNLLCEKRQLAQGIVESESALPKSLGLVHGVAVDVTGKTTGPKVGEYKMSSNKIVSDTKELIWSHDKEGANWIVDTVNTKVFSGFPNGRTFDISGVKLAIGETKLGWATISLLSHDATGFGEKDKPARILLTATGLSHNGGAKFKPEVNGDFISSRGDDWGNRKTVCEGIPATITMPSSATKTKCYALDERGERKASLEVTADEEGHAVIKIDSSYQTVWYEIEVI